MGKPNKRPYSVSERKAKKRKLEEAIPDIPDSDDVAPTQIRIDKPESAIPKYDGSIEKPRSSATSLVGIDGETQTEEHAPVKKSKKERKAERKAREAAEASKLSSGDSLVPGNVPIDPPKLNRNGDSSKRKTSEEDNYHGADQQENHNTYENNKAKPPRFIVFIGNLPFSATQDSIKEHFKAVKPVQVRHLTRKDDATKSRGCAFVEFDGYDHMKTCLKLYHHSMFDDGISPPRKINVELTAGGGGNTKSRRAKIQGKNQKLNEQRIRRIKEEEKAKLTKNETTSDHENAIHPSRRGLVSSA